MYLFMLNPLQTETITCKNLKPPTTLKLCIKVWVQHSNSYLNKINIIFILKEVYFQQNWRSVYCKTASTFSNAGAWSSVDNFHSEKFSRMPVSCGVFPANLFFIYYIYVYENKTARNFYQDLFSIHDVRCLLKGLNWIVMETKIIAWFSQRSVIFE